MHTFQLRAHCERKDGLYIIQLTNGQKYGIIAWLSNFHTLCISMESLAALKFRNKFTDWAVPSVFYLFENGFSSHCWGKEIIPLPVKALERFVPTVIFKIRSHTSGQNILIQSSSKSKLKISMPSATVQSRDNGYLGPALLLTKGLCSPHPNSYVGILLPQTDGIKSWCL